jgi:hypothetical protein
MEEVRLRDVPERVLLVERRKVVVAELTEFVRGAMRAQQAVLAEAGVAAAGSPYVAFASPVTDEVPGMVEVCTPVPDEVARRRDLALRVEPAHREAFTTVTKREAAYPAILEAFELVEVWARDAGLSPIAPSREIHLVDLALAADDDLVLDVAQPVA